MTMVEAMPLTIGESSAPFSFFQTPINASSSASAAEQLESFIAKFDATHKTLIRAARKALRKRFPTANELVYEQRLGARSMFEIGVPFGVLNQAGTSSAPAGTAPTGWTAGKLFERATANVAGPITTQSVLEGLWSIKDETLGGLTQPLTFSQGRAAEKTSCWFTITIERRAWTSPDQFKRQCVRLDR